MTARQRRGRKRIFINPWPKRYVCLQCAREKVLQWQSSWRKQVMSSVLAAAGVVCGAAVQAFKKA
jgi:transcription elongation factor Elf1